MFAKVLELLSEKKPVPTDSLIALSDLTPQGRELFVQVWRNMDERDRLQLVQTLASRSQEDLRADFFEVFSVALEDDSAAVRRAAVGALTEDTNGRLLDRLLALVETDPEASVRAAAADALASFAYRCEVGHLPESRLVQLEGVLLRALHNPHEDLLVRQAALCSVGYLSTERVRQEIARAYGDPDLRASAIRAMGRNCDPVWLPDLARETRSPDATLREEAARALGELEDGRGVQYLQDLVDDPHLSVRLAAIRSLGQIGGEDAREILFYCAEDKDQAVREAAEKALSELEFYEDPLAL